VLTDEQGGFIPDLVLWLSYFYTSRELPIRLSFFWTALSITTIVTSLLAFGIFHMHGVAGIAGWRWLFLLEGLITFLIGVASFFLMPASAVQTKTWLVTPMYELHVRHLLTSYTNFIGLDRMAGSQTANSPSWSIVYLEMIPAKAICTTDKPSHRNVSGRP
jgi:MFS family permease